MGLFVCRERQIERMRTLLDDHGGGSRVAFVAGEAGAGKSTLVEEFARRSHESHSMLVVLRAECNARTGRSDAYLPFKQVLTQLTGMVTTAPDGPERSHTESRSRLYQFSLDAIRDVAPDLIGALIPGAGLVLHASNLATRAARFSKVAPTTQQMAVGELDKERLFQQYGDAIARITKEIPLLIVLDDLHWADSASIDLLFYLARRPDASVRYIGTYRPTDILQTEARHPLDGALNELKRYYGDIVIDLDAADSEDQRAFVSALVDAEPNELDESFRTALFEHTGGQPLFTVELLHELKARGSLVRSSDGRWRTNGEVDWQVLPSRVEGVVEERLSRIDGKARGILDVAAVQGPRFIAQVVARLQDLSERECVRLLAHELAQRHRLVEETGTERIGKVWVTAYEFNHVLFQQYLYEQLSQRERMLLHLDTARMLEELWGADNEAIAAELATHYEQSGEIEEAVQYRALLARRALRVSAYGEAQVSIERGLEFLAKDPESVERDHAELELRSMLASVLSVTKGWDSPEVQTVNYRARELCTRLGEERRLGPILFGLWTKHVWRLELEEAFAVAQESVQVAERVGETSGLIQAQIAMCNTLFWKGRLTEAIDHAERALALFDPSIQASHVANYNQDPRIIPYMFVVLSRWLLGDVEQADRAEREQLRIAESVDHPFSLAMALYTSAQHAYHKREYPAARKHGERLIALSQEHGFPFYEGLGRTMRGWAVAQHDPEAGILDIEKGFSSWSSFGGRICHSTYCCMSAEGLLRQQRYVAALNRVESGLAVAHDCGELAYEAELYRLRAEILDALGREAEAAESLDLAVAAARRSGAVMLGRRAEAASMEGSG